MKWVRAGLLAIFLGGCATPRQPDFSAVASRQGLVNWGHESGSLTADLVLQRDAADRVRLTVIKGTTLLVLTQGREGWVATGPLARGGWRGPANAAPGPLAGWVALAEACGQAERAPEGGSEFRTGVFSARFDRAGDRLKALEVIAVANGDRFRVRF